ncbi:AMP-binding protein [Thiomicrorhabdus sp. ZW0627]|uniref:AMP-binding protein n=1 Tax=Thiomicrorhabdus sp. ZW0627 TaxID=3039774 RepID=UPI0024367813|nr:AMP-binding protein [Thiomicrorhabdus sp. ZW0627]MDG6774211.1 AMP-binding protein [Thiomicrorhabdus sp. ZW0627]
MKWLVKSFVRLLFRVFYRVEVKGLENYHAVDQSKQPLLIVANHVSLLDGPLIDLFVPGETTFMVGMNHAKKWYGKFVLYFGKFFTVDLHSPYAAKHMIAELKKGKQCMIFPEGRISTTGSLMKVYEGTAMVADKTHAAILPVHIRGAELSKLSYLNGRFYGFIQQFWFPKITLTILPAKNINPPARLKGHSRHHSLKENIYTLMRDLAYYGSVEEKSLFKALVKAKQVYHAKEICVEDINDQSLSLKKLVMASKVLGRQLHRVLGDEKRVGLMLPNVTGMPATFFALQAYGYIPSMMNFTAGLKAMKSACETAELRTIVTSRKFVDAFGLQPLIDEMEGVRFVYLEEVRADIGVIGKLTGLLSRTKSLPGYKKDPNSEAVVLFTSGSEGMPKGVVLSHTNLISNIEQISAMLTLLPGERLFNALPTFHSFGLTAGLIWPILKGARVFLYPSPLHYAVVPEMVYQTNARLMFGTDTFFNGYARKANPYDFYSVRAMVAGAERLRPETRQLYAEKFHTPIYEGYGVTETTPVLAVNTPVAFKNGSVGQLVPAVEYRIAEVPGIAEGGLLQVKGPNIMLGYLMPDEPGVLQPPVDGWHDTGDIVHVDEDGYVWIKGRAKRFAKIGGEMVSLTAVESYINQASPTGHHVVVSVPDSRKGEKLVLVTDDCELSRSTITDAAKEQQVADIMIPKTIILVEKIPVSGTGKTNYLEVQKIAEHHFGV